MQDGTRSFGRGARGATQHASSKCNSPGAHLDSAAFLLAHGGAHTLLPPAACTAAGLRSDTCGRAAKGEAAGEHEPGWNASTDDEAVAATTAHMVIARCSIWGRLRARSQAEALVQMPVAAATRTNNLLSRTPTNLNSPSYS
jgi:hypothetical protein